MNARMWGIAAIAMLATLATGGGLLIATPSIGLALLTFAWLERRAHRDG